MIMECALDIDDARVSPLDACCSDWSHRKVAQRVYSNMAPIALGGSWRGRQTSLLVWFGAQERLLSECRTGRQKRDHSCSENQVFRSILAKAAGLRVLAPILAKAAGLQVLGRSPAGFYLRLNKWVWQRLPSRVRDLYPLRSYGAWLHTLVCLRANRQQYFGTFFLREFARRSN